MAEINPFDPPDPEANSAAAAPLTAADLPTGGKPPVRRITTLQNLVPNQGTYAPLPNVEDRRQQDLANWQAGRYLDPMSFNYPATSHMPPGSFFPSDVPPIDPRVANSPMSQSLGTTAQIQQANLDDMYRLMQERKQAAMRPRGELKQKVKVP